MRRLESPSISPHICQGFENVDLVRVVVPSYFDHLCVYIHAATVFAIPKHFYTIFSQFNASILSRMISKIVPPGCGRVVGHLNATVSSYG